MRLASSLLKAWPLSWAYVRGHCDGFEDAERMLPLFAAMKREAPYVAAELLTQCCYCKRVRTGTGVWTQLEHARLVQVVSHGACDDCLKVRLMALKRRAGE